MDVLMSAVEAKLVIVCSFGTCTDKMRLLYRDAFFIRYKKCIIFLIGIIGESASLCKQILV